MERKVKLKDGTEVLIRELSVDDVGLSASFFAELPEEDRAYLRTDVTDRAVVESRIRAMDDNSIIRLVAVADGKIVADGSLESEGQGWKAHIAELRLIVAGPYQHRGMGKLLARELYLLAAGNKVEEIVVKMMGPQKRARTIFKKLGFSKDARFEDYVKDIHGIKHDLIIMRCDLEDLWRKLGDHMASSDWQRMR
jgi:L-amino acid N-acyltransferase YncA